MEVRLNVEQCVLTTDIDRRCQNLRHLYPLHGGSNWVYSGFPHNQNSRELSAAYVLWSEREDKHAWNAIRHANIVDAFCLHLFPHVWSANTDLWFGATPTSLSQLDAVQRACYPDHWPSWGWPSSLTKFSHWEPDEKLGALTLFHCIYYGEAPELLCQLLPEHLQLDPRLRRSVRSHDLAVQIPRSNLVSHKRSFVPSAARIWNSLPEYIPSLEKRACFKKEVNSYLGNN